MKEIVFDSLMRTSKFAKYHPQYEQWKAKQKIKTDDRSNIY